MISHQELYWLSVGVLLVGMCLCASARQPARAGEGSRPVKLPGVNAIAANVGDPMDVVPFGEIRTWEAGRDVGVLWEDARDIFRVVVTFADASDMPESSSVKLQYWRARGWPKGRVPREKSAFAGISGWMHSGDWYNGEWRDADTKLEKRSAAWTYTFNPADASEYKDLDFDGVYRTTMKIRLLMPEGSAMPACIQAFTDSTWKKVEAVVVWDPAAEFAWDGTVEAFNCRVEAIPPPLKGIREHALTITYAEPAAAISGDESVVTVRAGDRSFSFAPREVAEGARVYAPDYGVLVKRADDPTTWAEAVEAVRKADKPRYNQVSELPEQTLARAWSDMPRKGRIYMPLAVEGGRQHFNDQPSDRVSAHKGWVDRTPSSDTPRAKWEGETFSVSFGLPGFDEQNLARSGGASIEDGNLPIPTTWSEHDGVRYARTSFATTLAGKLPKEGRVPAEEPQVLMVRIRLTNLTHTARTVAVPIAVSEKSQGRLDLRDGLVYRKAEQGELLRLYLKTGDAADLRLEGDRVICELELPPGAAKHFYAHISFLTLDTPAEIEQLKRLDFDQQHAMIASYWRKRLSQSCRVVTPEPMINDFYSALPSHLLINTDNQIGGTGRAMAKVGTFSYGVYTNESVMMTTELDRRGYHDIARAAYETWIHYQGTVPLPGDYSTQEGVFYGANGYEDGGYNQHHGWALWGLAEHYWFTRDRAWLDYAAPSIVKACDWIIQQRQRTSGEEYEGIRAIERGMLPPGSLEDIGDWRCWLSNNVFSYWGMNNAARALADVGHPEARRLLKEAADYRRDIRKAFFEAMTRSPVQRLRDGTYVPIIPSEVHRRGRSLGWITETLEGAIHLIRCGVVDPDEPAAEWIMKDYEDNRYLAPQFGYQVQYPERDWFSLGGFSQQPSLLCSPTPYIMRDEPKHYLRSYFNAFAAGYFPERAMLTEHPLPNLGDYAGDHLKSSDEAMNSSWIRWMFIWDEGEDLHLGSVMPRYWLADGSKVSIERAVTHFGVMSMSIKSNAASGSIQMTIDPPIRNAPRAVYARFRHPDGKSMNRVTVNGAPWSNFDPGSERVILPPLKERTVVVAYYD